MRHDAPHLIGSPKGQVSGGARPLRQRSHRRRRVTPERTQPSPGGRARPAIRTLVAHPGAVSGCL